MLLTDILNQTPSQNKIYRPYIIAEAGVNHEGSMDLAKRLIDEAQEGGADAIKFQTYKASTLAAKESPAYWDLSKEPTTNQFELFKKHDKFWKSEFVKLKEYCDQIGIEFMSTPFDVESATFLNDLMPVFKISSSDLSNFPFIEFMCKFNKPIILSTGASYMWEIHEVVELISKYDVPLCLMHCVLNYPTLDENANLGMILDIKSHFPDKWIGYSDHTLPGEMDVLNSANLLGAAIIEKHFSHDKTLPGNDHYHAMDMHDLKLFRKKSDQIFKTLGEFKKSPLTSEGISRENARRSLVTKVHLPAGHKVTFEDLTWKRPASGISPKHINEVIGKEVVNNLNEDTVLKWSMLK